MSKQTIRNQTDAFLNNSQSSISSRIKPTDVPPSASNYREGPDRVLTGAAEPLLPMTISVGGKDGNTIMFTMLINPSTMNYGKTNAVLTAYTRKGWIPQIWGANQPILSSTGKTAAFMAPTVGLTSLMKKYSFGFLNFMGLVAAFKNNGYRLFDQTKVRNLTRVINVVQGIEISFDGQIFMGHFNTFTMDEVADTPFLFNYQFEFIISTTSNDYSYVRGHFIPPKQVTVNQTRPEFESSDRRTGYNGPGTVTLEQVSTNGAEVYVAPSKSRSDDSARAVWDQVTKEAFPGGLPWEEAIRLGYTDNSWKENCVLRGKLLAQGTALFTD